MFRSTPSSRSAAALILSALVAAHAQAEKPKFPYRTLPADIVVLKDLPPSPEPKLLRMAAEPQPAGAPGVRHPRGLHGTSTIGPQAVVTNSDGSGCTGPRLHPPGRPHCSATASH